MNRWYQAVRAPVPEAARRYGSYALQLAWYGGWPYIAAHEIVIDDIGVVSAACEGDLQQFIQRSTDLVLRIFLALQISGNE